MTGTTREIRTFSEDEELVSQRRRQIVDCAIQVFVRNGYQKTRMSDIARACGISKGLLYHYVSCKEDVLYLVAHDQAEGTIKGFGALQEQCKEMSPTDALLEYIRFYYKVVHDTQDYQVFLNQLAALLPRADRRILFDADRFALEILQEILERGVKSREFEIEDLTITAHNILLLGRTWADRRWFLARRYTFGQYLDIQTRAILRAIRPQAPAGTAGAD